MRLFRLDSKFMHAMSRIGDLLILNFFFLLTCVPIITIGAASTAMYTVCFRIDTEREQGTLKSYFRAFRDNFRQATLMWVLLLLFGIATAVNTYLFYSMPAPLHYVMVVFALLFVLVLMICSLAFPLQSQFDNKLKSTLFNAFVLSIAYLPRTLLITALNLFPFILLLKNFYMFLQTGFIWIAIYFSAAAYLNSILLRKVFAPYMPEEEDLPIEEEQL